ncbi:FAD binding domain-containing protein [Allonocardiopsis opalescens]|uniref:CO/xanthine dehydrogenase FAD-binding subunit n=1 Tax=Allonocardiopsis opalescens TaxID=1144618 RepID=A0A2T0QCM1_9ACTN|nr:FAD binding domain-containing protein [Allonocardiopsis opalescens]PRY01662.1 CO/xanthine dehydrogenase FAD-binding subunit [Allonocardiopsis opalescens]
MEFLRPADWDEALAMRAELPGARPLMGGTDVMVELNASGSEFGRPAELPEALIDLSGLPEPRGHGPDGGWLRLGAGVPYTRIVAELAARAPALAAAARTIGSPQIRNRGTVGGNLGAASPAGDAHPPLLATDAQVELASRGEVRRVPARDFYLAPRRTELRPDELIAAVLLPPAAGPQRFAKVGTRNAMVIAVCSFAIELRPALGEVGTGIGSAGPVPLRAHEAEDFLRAELADRWEARRPLPEAVERRFGELAARAARPIDDVRGSAAYRRHAVGVLARRTLRWAWEDYRKGADPCG